MRGPAPKDPGLRARRNKTATKAVLHPGGAQAPPLPEREWSPMTTAWWADVWASPMGPEYDESDKHGLFMLALLVDDFWGTETTDTRSRLAGEIRQQSQRFGLSPLDRMRLQWEIERTEEAVAKGSRRRQDPPKARPQGDPRTALHLA
ncbi:MAG: hypothetical protein WKF67_14935 [Rubrobacteraceae bacterium]